MGELGTGKTRVEVDRVGAAACWSLEVDVERGETRQRSRPGVARRHGTTSAEIEIKPGNGVRVRAEVEIKPPDIELEPETSRHDGNKSGASVTPCWRRLTPCWWDYELDMRGRQLCYARALLGVVVFVVYSHR
uniref:Uncharacterized protein n=1 Tax=Oryza meridionalis TaxID=40149 RepID=A0A0E0EEF4_9ORYZ